MVYSSVVQNCPKKLFFEDAEAGWLLADRIMGCLTTTTAHLMIRLTTNKEMNNYRYEQLDYYYTDYLWMTSTV